MLLFNVKKRTHTQNFDQYAEKKTQVLYSLCFFCPVLALLESTVSSGAFSSPASPERQHLSPNTHAIKCELPWGYVLTA